jgi:RNA polymerase sigma-70 factor (ECF subfamily)
MARTSKAAAASGSRAVRSGGEGVPASRIGPNPPKSLHPAPARSVYFAVMTAPRERALIRRILAGEKAAAEELISHHQPSLYAYMVRLTGRPETAEDVTQEAFVRALTHLERYDPRFRFSTWLFTIAKRLYVNANQRLAPSFDTEVVAGATARGTWGSVDFDRLEIKSGAAEALKVALEALSEEQREAVILFYQLNWSVEQIGEYMDLPAGTVKSHLHRARKRMKDALEASRQNTDRVREALA